VSTQDEKGRAFRALHARDHAFIIPNPWDVGSARLLAKLGFEALATTSAGYAFSLGKRDSAVGREAMLAHVKTIVEATDLPVSADLENGFGDDPETVEETIELAAASGLAGGSIEDRAPRTGAGESRIYDFEHAVERVRAAVQAARAHRSPFTLTARCENYLAGRPDLKDTIARLQAFQEAGADVLFAPGLKTKEDIETVVRSVDRPVNVIMGLQGVQLDRATLSAMGVKRISVGSSLARAAYGAFLRAAHEMHDRGSFTYAEQAVSMPEITGLFDA
jgi:2-methylisocitrate lyase-like PEP mutase family enzyme